MAQGGTAQTGRVEAELKQIAARLGENQKH